MKRNKGAISFPALIVGTILALTIGAVGCEADQLCPVENAVYWADEGCPDGAGDEAGAGGQGGTGGSNQAGTGGQGGTANQGGSGGTNQAGNGNQAGGTNQGGSDQGGGGGTVPLCEGPGESLPPCAQGKTDCGGCCVHTDADPNHCGVCGNACDDTTPFCGIGVCLAACFTPLEHCGGGQCVNTAIDEANCGSCETECDPGEICTNGLCQGP